MVWVRLDDRFPEHPKVASLSSDAFRAHVEALCYAARNETDGFIPGKIGLRLGFMGELLGAGLWEDVEGGYQIHDFLDYNPSAASLREKRDQAAERMRRVRANSPRTSPEPTSTPSPSPSPSPEPAPEPEPLPNDRVPSEPSSAHADVVRFQKLWNEVMSGSKIPEARSMAKRRAPRARAWLKFVAGDWERLRAVMEWFRHRDLHRDDGSRYGLDTFLVPEKMPGYVEQAEAWRGNGAAVSSSDPVPPGMRRVAMGGGRFMLVEDDDAEA